MHGEDDKLGTQARLLEIPQRVNAVQQRHGDFRNDDIGIAFFRQRDQFIAVSGRGHHVVELFQQLTQTIRQDPLMVGQEYPCAHASSLGDRARYSTKLAKARDSRGCPVVLLADRRITTWGTNTGYKCECGASAKDASFPAIELCLQWVLSGMALRAEKRVHFLVGY